MNEREELICRWFDMWIRQTDLGIDDIFTEDVVYTENWGPRYTDRSTVKPWFKEWNTRGVVLAWDIKQFFHSDNQTVVEWYFKSRMKDSDPDEFDGMTIVEWTADNRIRFLKEFGCNLHNYNPYAHDETPEPGNKTTFWS